MSFPFCFNLLPSPLFLWVTELTTVLPQFLAFKGFQHPQQTWEVDFSLHQADGDSEAAPGFCGKVNS